MISLAQIDPFLYGYFLDETLEHGERVGLALLYAAKNIDILYFKFFGELENLSLKKGSRIYPLAN